jgi:hypothetical protein
MSPNSPDAVGARVASVGPADGDDRRPSARNGAAHLGGVGRQPSGSCSMRRQVGDHNLDVVVA